MQSDHPSKQRNYYNAQRTPVKVSSTSQITKQLAFKSKLQEQDPIDKITIKYRSSYKRNTNKAMDPQKAAQKVFQLLKVNVIKQRYIRMKKQHKYRLCVIEELYKTEENYIKDLQISIMLSSIISQWINKSKVEKIFSNTKQIYKLNQDFFKSLRQIIYRDKDENNKNTTWSQNIKYRPYELVGKNICEYGPFFKLYFSYYQDFSKSQAMLEECKKASPEFAQYCKQMSNMKEYNFQDIESYLVKPVQRLPKYVLLLNDLIKHTSDDHPDYGHLNQALQIVQKVNNDNDSNLNKIIENSKLFELQRLYGSELEVVNSKRNFICEQFMTMFWKNKEKPVLVYILSDLILITERDTLTSLFVEDLQYKLISQLHLDDQSQIHDLEDSGYFKNMFMVQGKSGSVTFMEINSDLKQQKMAQLQLIIDDVKSIVKNREEALIKNNISVVTKHPIKVQVIGVQDRKTNAITSHKVYITEVQIGEVFQKIFLRFSQCLAMSDELKKVYPQSHLNYIKHSNISMTTDDKEIEGRMIQLTNFLASLLQQQFMREDIKYLIQLGLPADFYNLPNLVTDQIRSQPRNRSIRGPDRMTYLSPQRSLIRVGSVVTLDDKNKSAVFSKKFSATQLLKQEGIKPKVTEKSDKNTLSVTIYHYDPKEKPITMSINSDARATDICEQLQQKFQMQEIFDFRLMIIDNKSRLKPLEGDEIVANSFGHSLLSTFQKKELFLRKYLFFELPIEKAQYYEDNNKLRLVYYQLLDEVVKAQYYFSFEEYCKLAAGYLYVLDKPIIYELMFNVVPAAVVKAERKEVWMLRVGKELEALRSSMDSELSIHETIVKQAPPVNKERGMMTFIQLLYDNPLCGQQLFSVVCKEQAKLFGEQNLVLTIGYKGIRLFDSRKKRQLMELDNISEIRVFPGSIQINETNQQQLKLETTQGFQIQQLYEEYRSIMQDMQASP